MVVIGKMREVDRGAAERFAAQAMYARYRCKPYPLPECVLAAVDAQGVCGVISVDPFHGSLEERYEFAPSSRTLLAQKAALIGRWSSNLPQVGEGLLYAAISEALSWGCIYGVSEMTRVVVRRLQGLGLCPIHFPGRYFLEKIPKDILPYYSFRPSVYGISLTEGHRALRGRVGRLIGAGILSLSGR